MSERRFDEAGLQALRLTLAAVVDPHDPTVIQVVVRELGTDVHKFAALMDSLTKTAAGFALAAYGPTVAETLAQLIAVEEELAP